MQYIAYRHAIYGICPLWSKLNNSQSVRLWIIYNLYIIIISWTIFDLQAASCGGKPLRWGELAAKLAKLVKSKYFLSFQENTGLVTKRFICKSFKSSFQAQKAWSEMLEEAKLLQVVKHIDWMNCKYILNCIDRGYEKAFGLLIPGVFLSVLPHFH